MSPPAAESAVGAVRGRLAADPGREAQAINELSGATGTRSKELAALFLMQACNTLPGPKDEPLEVGFQTVLPALQGIAATERYLGAQL